MSYEPLRGPAASGPAPPELSVIVPVYNEEGNIAPFLALLAAQQGVRMEVIISDGGSGDAGVAEAEAQAAHLPFPVRVLRGGRGRAAQLNRGAASALAPTLLFLHIDSHLVQPQALRRGLDSLAAAAATACCCAAHFTLEFEFPAVIPLPYRFYGAKATLDRPGCTHGDQGFLISAALFRRLGPFDTSLPIMEDTFLAERVRAEGKWLLLPDRIRTSPRRFLTEGLLPRQTLNAVLSALAALGRFDLIEELRGSYRSQHQAQRLRLGPFLEPLARAISGLPPGERLRFWYRAGSYVRGNAWQVPFFLDVCLGWVREGEGGRLLDWHDRWLGRVLDNAVANCLAATLVWVWFRGIRALSR